MSESRNNSESEKIPFPGLRERLSDRRNASIQEETETLKNIDTLIEELETESISNHSFTSYEYNEALRKRRIKIDELKTLREELNKKIEDDTKKAIEESAIDDIEQKNEEIDDKISLLKRLLSKEDSQDDSRNDNYIGSTTIHPSESRYSSESRGEKPIRRTLGFSSESRSSGESRW